ncbi:hypothetical protein TSUD_135260 [Trifolium subterraneum]|uniref:Uncharacterized protein n=1 Tax=Trifolium subterraneum TaxID=3900 RepID=A0A2Z6NP38_TRISU|nr:hypothetical protein TSUD_135260 [Trifolium subterraneum]
MKKYKDSDQVIRFLKGLNEQYYDVRSQIMLMEPLPNIAKVYSLLVQQERKVVLPIDESKLLAVNGHNSYAGRGQSNRDNHVIDDYWKKYGYPPHMQHLQNKNGAVNSCANANGDDETQTITYEEENVDLEAGKMFFTPAQHKALLAFLQGSQSLPSHSINHVTTNSGNFVVYRNMLLIVHGFNHASEASHHTVTFTCIGSPRCL